MKTVRPSPFNWTSIYQWEWKTPNSRDNTKLCCCQLPSLARWTSLTSDNQRIGPVQSAILFVKHGWLRICPRFYCTIHMKWSRPQTWWFLHRQEECRVLLGHLLSRFTPRRSITKQKTTFVPRIDRSSCPRSEPWSSYMVISGRDAVHET